MTMKKEDGEISESTLKAEATKGGKTGKEAQLALILRKVRRRKKKAS